LPLVFEQIEQRRCHIVLAVPGRCIEPLGEAVEPVLGRLGSFLGRRGVGAQRWQLGYDRLELFG